VSFADDIGGFIAAELSRTGLTEKLQEIADATLDQIKRDYQEGPWHLTSETPTEIDYSLNVLPDAVNFALAELMRLAPDKSGQFRSSFFVVINGGSVQNTPGGIALIPDTARTVVIGNTQPYNRRVEVQLVGKEPIHFDIPPKLYERAAQSVRDTYGDVLKVSKLYNYKFPGRYVPRFAGYKFHSPAIRLTAV
jgi:hypothetical protein